MSENAIQQIIGDFQRVIKRHTMESDISYAELLGAIEFISTELKIQAFGIVCEEDEEE